MQCKSDSSSYNLDFVNLDNFLTEESRVCPTSDATRKVCRLIVKLISYRTSEAALVWAPVPVSLFLAYFINHHFLLFQSDTSLCERSQADGVQWCHEKRPFRAYELLNILPISMIDRLFNRT